MKLLQVPAFQFGRQENVVCIWMNLESKIRWSSSSYFMLFMQLWTCYAVFFLSVACHFFSKLFGHCDKCIQCHSIACNIWFPHTQISGNGETLNQWSLGLVSASRRYIFTSLIFSLKKKNLQVLFLKSQCLLSRLSRVASRHPMSLSWLRMAEKRCSGVASQSVTSNSHLLE